MSESSSKLTEIFMGVLEDGLLEEPDDSKLIEFVLNIGNINWTGKEDH